MNIVGMKIAMTNVNREKYRTLAEQTLAAVHTHTHTHTRLFTDSGRDALGRQNAKIVVFLSMHKREKEEEYNRLE